jgi:hypothetical protein
MEKAKLRAKYSERLTPIPEELMGDAYRERALNSNLSFKIRNSIKGAVLCGLLLMITCIVLVIPLLTCENSLCEYLKDRFLLTALLRLLK